jgi:hypothetical protein
MRFWDSPAEDFGQLTAVAAVNRKNERFLSVGTTQRMNTQEIIRFRMRPMQYTSQTGSGGTALKNARIAAQSSGGQCPPRF